MSSADGIAAAIERVYREESRAVLATLIRLLGSFELAEEAMHEAFAVASATWPRDGIPRNPRSWLISTGRFRTIDRLRRRTRLDATLGELAMEMEQAASEAGPDEPPIVDDTLRLIFTCCHPALAEDARVALTLREVCGLTTEAVARAFLVPAPTLTQRIVRAKARIRDAAIRYEVPEAPELPERLDSVLSVIYLIFNEGYLPSAGGRLTRSELAAEAIRLGRLLMALLPDAEVVGLLALMLLQDSRRAARQAADGALVLLADQDRALWDRAEIAEGLALVERALAGPEIGAYALQAAIAAEHARVDEPDRTDWGRIVALYDLLRRADPSPVVGLNRAVAVAMRDGPAAGLALIDGLLAGGELTGYRFAHAARADFCRRLGRVDAARSAYERALSLTPEGPEHDFLRGRVAELGI